MPAPLPSVLPVLALDTSTETLAAGLQTSRGAFTVLAPGGAAASSALLPQLRGLLDRAGLAWADVRSIAFGRGPGAFTGLRTACAVAQGLGYGLGLRLLPLDSLLIVAEDARAQADPAPEAATEFDVAVAMDARMGEIYAAQYRWSQGAWKVLQSPALLSLPALHDAWTLLPPRAVAGSALVALAERLQMPAGVPSFAAERDRAAALLRLAVRAASAGEGVAPQDALPLYLRDKVAFTTAEREASKAQAALS